MSPIANSDVFEILSQDISLSGAEILTPGAPGYDESIKRWSDTCEKHAGAVVKVTNADEISAVLRFAQAHGIPLTVHCSGHSTSGSSSIEGGIVIDLTKMRNVTVNADSKEITVQGGARWEDVDLAAAKYGLATVGGTVNHTGVGGLTLGGGYGWLSGRYGLSIDCLLRVKIVLANGKQVTTSETENPDLFWAVRGAGHSFGVVTEFTFRGFDQKEPVWAGLLIFTPDKLRSIVKFANKHHRVNNGDQCLVLGFSAPPPEGHTVVLTVVFHNGPKEDGEKYYADLLALEPVVNTTAAIPYEQLNGIINHVATYGGRKMFGGGHVKMPLEYSFVEDIFKTFDEFVNSHENVGESVCAFELFPYGKVCEVPQDAMAFANRGHYYNVATCTRWYDPNNDGVAKDFSRTLSKKISQQGGLQEEKLGSKAEGVGVYANYLPSNEVRSKDVFGINTQRLRELKKKYDPNNVFRKFHNVLSERSS